MIACSKEAKAAGCKNVMRVPEALALCPDLVLVTQRPDMFRRAHQALLNEISCEIPIETVKSIDELTCTLDAAAIADPRGLASRINGRIVPSHPSILNGEFRTAAKNRRFFRIISLSARGRTGALMTNCKTSGPRVRTRMRREAEG